MGQGTHTKIAQLVANSLGLPYSLVHISSTNTAKVPNTSASAASSTTDLNGAAALNAVAKIKLNLEKFMRYLKVVFLFLVRRSYVGRGCGRRQEPYGL